MTSDVHNLNETSITTPGDTEIRFERIFNAPRGLVWDVHTDPELLPEWLGPREQILTVETMDMRPGGAYRYTSRGPDGNEHAFFGEYREVTAPRLLVATFNYEGVERTSIDHLELEELDGDRTRLIGISTFASRDERDAMLKSGMERGVRVGYERLDEVLVRLQDQS